MCASSRCQPHPTVARVYTPLATARGVRGGTPLSRRLVSPRPADGKLIVSSATRLSLFSSAAVHLADDDVDFIVRSRRLCRVGSEESTTTRRSSCESAATVVGEERVVSTISCRCVACQLCNPIALLLLLLARRPIGPSGDDGGRILLLSPSPMSSDYTRDAIAGHRSARRAKRRLACVCATDQRLG